MKTKEYLTPVTQVSALMTEKLFCQSSYSSTLDSWEEEDIN